jgi:hypothetical protein
MYFIILVQPTVARLAELRATNFFIYLFYHDFAKIYGPSQILQKYTSGVVAHGVRT